MGLLTDWRTTVTSIVGAAAFLINSFFGLEIPETAIVAVVVFVIGLLAKDSTPTDGTVE